MLSATLRLWRLPHSRESRLSTPSALANAPSALASAASERPCTSPSEPSSVFTCTPCSSTRPDTFSTRPPISTSFLPRRSRTQSRVAHPEKRMTMASRSTARLATFRIHTSLKCLKPGSMRNRRAVQHPSHEAPDLPAGEFVLPRWNCRAHDPRNRHFLVILTRGPCKPYIVEKIPKPPRTGAPGHRLSPGRSCRIVANGYVGRDLVEILPEVSQLLALVVHVHPDQIPNGNHREHAPILDHEQVPDIRVVHLANGRLIVVVRIRPDDPDGHDVHDGSPAGVTSRFGDHGVTLHREEKIRAHDVTQLLHRWPSPAWSPFASRCPPPESATDR